MRRKSGWSTTFAVAWEDTPLLLAKQPSRQYAGPRAMEFCNGRILFSIRMRHGMPRVCVTAMWARTLTVALYVRMIYTAERLYT